MATLAIPAVRHSVCLLVPFVTSIGHFACVPQLVNGFKIFIRFLLRIFISSPLFCFNPTLKPKLKPREWCHKILVTMWLSEWHTAGVAILNHVGASGGVLVVRCRECNVWSGDIFPHSDNPLEDISHISPLWSNYSLILKVNCYYLPPL